jgi:nucleoside-diphosphate-sugar epimerase
LLLLENSARTTGEIFNIGHPKEIAVIDVAKCILKHMKKDVDMGLYRAPAGSVSRRAPNITKIKNAVGWTPTIDLDEGIKNTVEAMT